MRRRKRTEVTIETDEILIVRRPGRPVVSWCPKCRAMVRMIRPERAAVLASVSVREIYRRVESGKMHGTADDPLLVCFGRPGDLLTCGGSAL